MWQAVSFVVWTSQEGHVFRSDPGCNSVAKLEREAEEAVEIAMKLQCNFELLQDCQFSAQKEKKSSLEKRLICWIQTSSVSPDMVPPCTWALVLPRAGLCIHGAQILLSYSDFFWFMGKGHEAAVTEFTLPWKKSSHAQGKAWLQHHHPVFSMVLNWVRADWKKSNRDQK